MIKSLVLKAETFNNYCTIIHEASDLVRDVCFDIQLQFVEFFTASIKRIRAAGKMQSASLLDFKGIIDP